MANQQETTVTIAEGGVFKVRKPRVICAVYDCWVSAEYDIHMEVPDKFLRGMTVPVCAKHGDYITSGKALEYEEEPDRPSNLVPL